MYTVNIVVNRQGLQAWEHPCEPLWLIISGQVMEKFQFHYSVACSAPVECKA